MNRASVTPRRAGAQYDYLLRHIDVRKSLPFIRVPTLVLHSRENTYVPLAQRRYLAEHIAARVGALACPGEVLVSSTVKDLVVGSDIDFEDRGEHELKGLPEPWKLYGVTGSAAR